MSKNMRRLTALISLIFAILSMRTVSAETPVRVFLSGEEISYDVPPQIISGRTMVPLRATVEAVTGAEMEWDAETKTVTFSAGGKTNTHKLEENVVYSNGVPIEFDTPSLTIDSRALVPIRMIAEATGCAVEWDAENRFVIIKDTEKQDDTGILSTVEINGLRPEKMSIIKGESTDIKIKTNSGAEYVWVDYDGISVDAAPEGTDKNGDKTWVVKCTPSATQGLRIFANSSRSESGAVTETQYIEVVRAKNSVSGSTGDAPSITSVSQSYKTIEISDDSGISYEAPVLSIRTSSDINYVWLEYDSPTQRAYEDAAEDTGIFETSGNGEKSWTITIPSIARNEHVFASRYPRGTSSAYESLAVKINRRPVNILNFSFDKTTITQGEMVTLSITAHDSSGPFWVEYFDESGPRRADAVCRSVFSEEDRSYWVAGFYPSETQTVRVCANNNVSLLNRVTYTFDSYERPAAAYEIDITVVQNKTPEIISFKTQPEISGASGDVVINKDGELTVTVQTNNCVNYVWVEEFGGKRWGGENYSTDEEGNKYWQIICYPSFTGVKSLLANTKDSGSIGTALKFLHVVVNVKD